MRILVTGGMGMVGKNLQRIMPNAYYMSSKEYDLTIQSDVYRLMMNYRPDVVIHLAAVVSGIIDNIKRPVQHLEDNLLMNTMLLKAAKENKVPRFIAILSTCAYPDVATKYPLSEDQLHESAPVKTNFGYGLSKRIMATHIDTYKEQYGLDYSYLIPCNLYGTDDKYDSTRSHYIAALIEKIYEAKKKKAESITLYGNGMPLRQFIMASDFAKIIKQVVEQNITTSFNVAPDESMTVKKIAHIALMACDATELKINWDTSMPNGQMNKTADNVRLKSIFPDFRFTSLEEGIRQTYKEYELWRQQSL